MKELQTIDADTLMSTPLPVTKFIVEGLLPEGLHILAGSPKVGKSWLALWLCFQVSKGSPLPRATYSTSVWRTATPVFKADCSRSQMMRLAHFTSQTYPKALEMVWKSRSHHFCLNIRI